MSTVNYVTTGNLGPEFELGTNVANAITMKVDGTTIVRDGVTGELSAVAVADLNTTVSDETGADYGGGAPLSAPASPDTGDLHQEIYDDVTAYFTAVAGAFPAAAQVTVARDTTALADALLAATDATGDGGTSGAAARADHRHAAQAPSADANNLLVPGADGLHRLTVADAISADAGNRLVAGTDQGLLVAPATAALSAGVAAGSIKATVDGVDSADFDLGAVVRPLADVELCDAFGVNIGFAFSTDT